jgi:HK97 family phage major capsid protein
MDPEVKKLLTELNAAVADIKKNYDVNTADVQDRIFDLETRAERIAAGGGGRGTGSRPEALKAFNSFLRGGDPRAMQAFAPQDASSTQFGPDVGFGIPEEVSQQIQKLELSFSPMRRFARVRMVSTDRPETLVNTRGVTSGWVGEIQARPATLTDQLAVVTPMMGEIYANPAVTQRSVDDVFYDLQTYVAESVAEVFAANEGAAFATGDGIQKPKGMLSYPTSLLADATRPFGTIQRLNTGVAGDWAAANKGDILVNLVHALRAPYRQGAAFWMNSKTLAAVRLLKDGQGNYLWRAGSGNLAGQPDTLLGYAIAEDENMPDIAANSLSIGFGNFMRAYEIDDHKVGVRMLRDNITQKGFVSFYTTKRTGGGLTNSQCLKLIQFA